MTLSLATITSSGIILSADSRQTYKNAGGMVRIGSDNAMKLFQLTENCGVVIAGRAFLLDGKGVLRNVGAYIEEFRQKELADPSALTIKQIAEKLCKHLSDIYVEKEIAQLKSQIEAEITGLGGTELTYNERSGNNLPYSFKDKDGKKVERTGSIAEGIDLIVAGVDKDNVGRAYSGKASSGVGLERDTEGCGAMWIGQTDILTRVVKGYDPLIGNLDFVKEAAEAKKPVSDQLNSLEYIINWGTMTLQDAIDFCILITRTTESIQRFSDGTVMFPGGITGVGGHIDVAVITPEKGFVWLKKKQLNTEGSKVNLDDQPNLKDEIR